jgi:LYR motif-containing protein 4
MFDTISTIRLYRSILRLAARFPSIKRPKIIREIRLTFRQNKHLTDENEIRKCFAVAKKGVEQLSMYSNLNRNSVNWTVQLEKNPMPKSEKEN